MMIQLLFLLSVCWGAKPYQKNTDLHIIGKYHTTKTGEKAEFLLDVTDVTGTETLQPSDYSFIAQGQSNGQPWEIEDVSSEQKTTVLLFDHSVSMIRNGRKYHNGQDLLKSAAVTFLQSLTQNQKQDHTIDIMLGATSVYPQAEDLSPLDAINSVQAIPKPTQKNTMLSAALKAAINKATEGNKISDGGSRQVILFSDGLEETDFTPADADAIVEFAHSKGVQIHLLFIATREYSDKIQGVFTTSEVDRITNIKLVAQGTGGVNATEAMQDPQQLLEKGAKDIANKIGKVIRVKTTLCEVQQSGTGIEVGVKYGSSNIAYTSFDMQKNSVTEQPCSCTPACTGNKICKLGKCVPPNQSTADTGDTGTPTPPVATPIDWSDYWWLLPLALLPLLLLRRKKNGSSPISDSTSNDPVSTEPEPSFVAPIATKHRWMIDEVQSWSLIGEVFKGHPSKNHKISEFTLMNKCVIFGNPNADPQDLHPTHKLNIPGIQWHHLEVLLKDDFDEDGYPIVEVINLQDQVIMGIEGFDDEDESSKGQLQHNIKERIDISKDIICLIWPDDDHETIFGSSEDGDFWSSNDSSRDNRIYLVLTEPIEEHKSGHGGTIYNENQPTKPRSSAPETTSAPEPSTKKTRRPRKRTKTTFKPIK